jgi:hypothetical protein
MPMHNPPHPGEFIREVYLEPNDITGRQLASASFRLYVRPSRWNDRVIWQPSGARSIIAGQEPNDLACRIAGAVYVILQVP